MTKGERIHELRISAGLTMEELAAKLNTTKQTIGKYEKGIVTNIPSDKIELMADILNTTPDYILGWNVKENNSTIAGAALKMMNNPELTSVIEKVVTLNSKQLATLSLFLDTLLD